MAIGTRLTAEEYLALAPNGRPSDLVRGEIVEMNPPGLRHCGVCALIAWRLTDFAVPKRLGFAFTNDAGVITERSPDSVRGADVSFYTASSEPNAKTNPGYARTPPLVVFEVRSPSDRASEVLAKIVEYLRVGVATVVVLDPGQRIATYYTSDVVGTELSETEVLPLPPPLSELRATVGEWMGET